MSEVNKDTKVKNLEDRVRYLETILQQNQITAKVIGITCPACGSDKVKTEEIEEEFSVPYGSKEKTLLFKDTCLSCRESGDFDGHNDHFINEALQRSKDLAIKFILESFRTKGFQFPYLARLIGCSPLDLEDIYEDPCSDDDMLLSLLQLLHTFPWLLKVLDSNFENTDVESLMEGSKNA